ncbi:MAG: hypothetical protein EAZ91_02345 [Cytophagales bacterium]|nr:MAG: hypothetical protein EAZ91_02345 [Cytophagales bacterium]
MPFILRLFLFLFVHQSVFAQGFSACGTDEYNRQRQATDSLYRAFVLNARAVETTDKAADKSLLTIPVVFVVYHLGEPVGQGSNVPESVLRAQVELMNRQYGATSGVAANGGTDTRIRFVMARRGVGCTTANGVYRLDGRSVGGYAAAGVNYLDTDMQLRLETLAGPAINQLGQQAVIVRVYWQVTGAGGWATFGGDISVGAPSMFYTSPYDDLMAHEMGHVLFLNHTFLGGDNNVNCPPNANPATQGDEVADTDPHLKAYPTDACSIESESQINICTGQAFGKIGRNIMSYGCRKYIFTPGQIARMRGYLAGSLSRFVNSPYAFPPTAAEGLLAASCTPTSGVTATVTYQKEGIARVQLAQLDSRTEYTGSRALLYDDFSCLRQATLRAGQSYTVTLDAPFVNTHRRVYIDWNGNGTFDETTERVFSTAIGEDAGTFVTPPTALTGQNLRMRVVVCEGNVAPSACFVPTLGAVQDIAVRVEPAATPAQVQLGVLNNLSLCSGGSVLLPYTLGSGGSLSAVGVSAELSDATGGFGNPLLLATGTGGVLTAELPTTLTTGTGYRIRLSAAGFAPDQTPPLTIRQTPTGTLVGSTSTIVGRVMPLTITLTGAGPWVVSTVVTPAPSDYYLPGQYESLTLTAASTTLTAQPSGTAVYQLATVESGGCVGTSTGAALTVVALCRPPESLTEADPTTSSTYLRWEQLGYRNYFVQWKDATASSWTSLPAQPYTEAYLSALVLGRVYEWRVAAACSTTQNSAYSPIRSFTLNCPVPTDIYEGITPTSATFGWYGGGASTYEVRWRPTGASSWTTISGLTNPSYTLPNPAPGGAYEWQVSSGCVGGSRSVLTPVRSITLGCKPPLSPFYSSVGSTTAQVGWWQVPGQQYTVRWRAKNTINWVTLAPVASGVTTLTGLPSGQTVEWQVASVCSGSVVSAFSPTQEFPTNCANLGLPTVGSITSYSALISWVSQSVASWTVQWRKVGATAWSVQSVVGSSPFALLGLSNNTTYEVRLGAVGLHGYACAVGSSVTFTTANCALPGLLTLSGPGVGFSGVPITLIASLSGIAPYSFTLNTGASFAGVGTSPVSFTTALNNPSDFFVDRYVSVVALANSCGVVNPSGLSVQVVLPVACGAPPTNLRIVGQGTTTALLAWDLGPNASSAQLQWRVAGATTWNTVSNVYTGYFFTGLTYGQAYEWRVQVVCDDGQPITPSTIQSFTMNCPMPYSQTETVSTSTVRLNWGYQWSASVPVTYNLRWRAVGAPTWNTINNLNATTHTLSSLSALTAYEWQLQTSCSGGGLTAFSPVRTFTTVCGMPEMPFVNSVTSTTATMMWLNLVGVQYTLRYRITTPEPWATNPTLFTANTGSLTGLIGGNTYHVQVQALCANGQRSPFSESAFLTTPCGSFMQTVASGNWTDPAIWSCNRIPVPTDVVSVRHAVTLPANALYRVLRLGYQAGGGLLFGVGARLRLGP